LYALGSIALADDTRAAEGAGVQLCIGWWFVLLTVIDTNVKSYYSLGHGPELQPSVEAVKPDWQAWTR
jgi:hypothetical protein